MKVKAIRRELIDVEISDDTLLDILSDLMDKIYDFKPDFTYVEDGLVKFDYKQHRWETEVVRDATIDDVWCQNFYNAVAEHLAKNDRQRS